MPEIAPAAYTEVPSAFISYSREDTEFVMRLAGDLKASGANVWLDQLDIPAGERWDRAVEGALAGSPVMIVVLSAASVASVNVMDEVSYALGKQKTVIPILIQDCAIPFRLLRIQHVDFRRDYARGMTALLKELGVPAPGSSESEEQRAAREAQRAAAERAALEQARRERRKSEGANSNKFVVIGCAVAAVALIAVLSVLLIRDREPNTKPGGAQVGSQTTQPNPPQPAPTLITPSGNGSGPRSQPSAPPPAPMPVVPATDPIVGCYQWYNGSPVVIRADHTAIGGPFTATWQLVNAAKRTYTVTWPQPSIYTVAMPPPGRTMSGGNQYGVSITGTRPYPGANIVGAWTWVVGAPFSITFDSNGAYSAALSTGTFHGTWQQVYGSSGVYTVKSAELPIDTLTLSADGQRLAGGNQYGGATTGLKTEPCSIN